MLARDNSLVPILSPEALHVANKIAQRCYAETRLVNRPRPIQNISGIRPPIEDRPTNAVSNTKIDF